MTKPKGVWRYDSSGREAHSNPNIAKSKQGKITTCLIGAKDPGHVRK
jgi:hypothetical protein